MSSMFDTLIVQPIFNLLVFIYAILPAHDFGVSIILFTVVVRLLMWPLLRKQLHQARLMRQLQPKIKQIKAKSKGDKQKEAQALMELYKEHGVSPFTSLGLLFVQLPIFIGLFSALNKLINQPQTIIDFSYGFIKQLPQMQEVVADLNNFQPDFIGLFSVTERGLSGGQIIWSIAAVAAVAGIFQFLQTRQLTSSQSKRKKLRDILKDSAKGKQAEQSDINAAVGGSMGIIFAPLIFYISLISPAGLALYFATSGVVGYLQQRFVLGRDVEEMEEIADKPAPAKTTKPRKTKQTRATRTKKKA